MAETRITEDVRSAVDIEAAFAYVADFDHQAAWDPNTVSSRRLTELPVGVGSRFALEVRMGRGTTPMEYHITAFEPPTRVVLVGEGERIWTEDAIEFGQESGLTVVRYAARIRLEGPLGWVQPLLGRAFRSIGQGAAAGLQRELDRIAREQA